MRPSAVPILPLMTLLAACSSAPRRAAVPSAALPADVAVLPFENEAVDLQAPGLLRKMVAEGLPARGYRPADMERVDEALRELGVTDGGQLRALEPAKVAKALGVPGLLYGTVEDFAFQNVGFVTRRIVRLRLRLVDAEGRELWSGVGKAEEAKAALDSEKAGRQFVRGVFRKAAETAYGVPLEAESRRAVRRLMKDIPGR